MNLAQLEAEEEQLRSQVNALCDAKRKRFYQLQKQRIKDPDTYATLNWFFAAGLHHFYLGKTHRGLVNLVLMLIGFLCIQSIGGLLITLVIIIEIPQLFKSQQIVYKYNNHVMAEILKELNLQ